MKNKSKENVTNYTQTFRLSLLFAFMVFVTILATMFILFCITFVMIRFGWIEITKFQRLPLFLFAIVSIIVGTVIALVISHKPLTPLKNIMEATDKIANGDYSVRVTPKGIECFRQLGEKFNHMAEELESVEMLRSDFVNNFSHEFKTPIVSIRGFAKALKWDTLTDRSEMNIWVL